VKSVSYFWVATVYIRVPLLMLSMKLTTLVSAVVVDVVVDGNVELVDAVAVETNEEATFVIALIVEYIDML